MVQDGDLIAIRRKELGMLDSEQLESNDRGQANGVVAGVSMINLVNS